MIVIANNQTEPVGSIRLKLKSLNVNVYHRIYSEFIDARTEYEEGSLNIDFRDSQEINEMIEMLQMFKRKCDEYVGEWSNEK